MRATERVKQAPLTERSRPADGVAGSPEGNVCAPLSAWARELAASVGAPERPATVPLALPQPGGKTRAPRIQVIDRRGVDDLFSILEEGRLGGRRSPGAAAVAGKKVATAAAALERYGPAPVHAKLLTAFRGLGDRERAGDLAHRFADALRGLQDCGRIETIDVSASLRNMRELFTELRTAGQVSREPRGPAARALRELPVVLAKYLERLVLVKIERHEIDREAVKLFAATIHDLQTKSFADVPIVGISAACT